MAKTRLLLLTYDATVAADGASVVCAVSGPVSCSSKEPVGHVFHYKVLLQQGLIGKYQIATYNNHNINFGLVWFERAAHCVHVLMVL